jgi:hypothetical protein
MTGNPRALPLLLAMLVGLCLMASPVLAAGNGNAGGQGNSGNAGNNAGGNGKSNAGGNRKSNAGGNSANSGSGVQDSNAALGLREAGRIHSLTDAYAVAERQFGGEVIDATLADNAAGGWTYELRLVTDDGRVRTLSYDATTLALLTIDGYPAH